MHVAVRRRTWSLALLALGAVAVAAVAFSVLGRDEGEVKAAALPLHPVAGSFRPDATSLAECSEQTCFEQAYGNIAYRKGPKTALALFDEQYGDGSDPGCHRVAHTIGAAALSRYEDNVARTFAEGSASCWSGYYHGVLERALLGVRGYQPEALAAVSRGLCDDDRVRAVTWLAYQCLHGLGHGLMITTGYDLALSLKVCNRLSTNWDQESCKGGAFMENISSSYGVQSRWVRDDDPVYPCNAVAQDDKHTCYQLVTSRILRVVGVNWEKTAEICAGVEEGWVSSCFQSFGRDVAGQTHRNAEEISQICAVARPYGGEKDCVMFAAMDMTANFTSGKQAAVLCTATSTGLRGACFRAIGTIMGRFKTTVAERKADCRSIASVPRDAALCIRGATGQRLPASIAR